MQSTDKPDLAALFDSFDSFDSFDGDWKSITRSIRIDGMVTSVRLETFYWSVVADIAVQQNIEIPELMTRLSRIAKSGVVKHTNFTSFVRVCCGRYLDQQTREQQSRSAEPSSTAGTTAEDTSVAVTVSKHEESEPVDE